MTSSSEYAKTTICSSSEPSDSPFCPDVATNRQTRYDGLFAISVDNRRPFFQIVSEAYAYTVLKLSVCVWPWHAYYSILYCVYCGRVGTPPSALEARSTAAVSARLPEVLEAVIRDAAVSAYVTLQCSSEYRNVSRRSSSKTVSYVRSTFPRSRSHYSRTSWMCLFFSSVQPTPIA